MPAISDVRLMTDRSKVIAFVNPKSGERSSADFLRQELCRILHSDRVIDLSTCFKDQTPATACIQRFAMGGTVIVAGGDGTVSFAMDIVDQLDWSALGEANRPHITVIPMGTGNDLSRALLFGPGFSKDKCCCACSQCCRVASLDDTVDFAVNAPKSTMDRWLLSVTAPSRGHAAVDARKMNNYFSIGFDAHIAKIFDSKRKAHPGCFNSRLMNKAWYGLFGCGALCGEPTLETSVKLFVRKTAAASEEEIPLPPGIKSLIVSNVDSFAGGVKLWKDSTNRFLPVAVNDGLLEVQGVFGSTHMGMMQIRLRNAEKIVQAADIRIETTQKHWMQWDGEALDAVQEEEGGVCIRIGLSSKPKIHNAALSTPAK